MYNDPFISSPSQHPDEVARPAAVSLFELNSMVRAALTHTLRDCYWIVAEISELRVASNGHCYMELVQKDEYSGGLVAKARANIWRQNYPMLSSLFLRVTGQRLDAGMKVMLGVTITFHELYGYSLNVIDIEPSYTLGDLARQRQEILRQLEEDGVLELNKELPLPRVIRNVAIVSSASAAGYGDFCNQLQQSGFFFNVKLFAAVMQGDKVEQSVLSALDKVLADDEDWDVVVIIRGGGASTDLHGFDTYLLAATVAQFPIPVLTGIGHERDDTVIDLVANTRLKTPTAVAAFLIDSRQNEVGQLQFLIQRLQQSVEQRLLQERNRVDALNRDIRYGASVVTEQEKGKFLQLVHRFELSSSRYTSSQRERLLRLRSRLEILTDRNFQMAHHELLPYEARIHTAVRNLFLAYHHKHDMLERSIQLASPERIYAMGFSIASCQGRVVKSAKQLKPGDVLLTTFQNGCVTSIVDGDSQNT